MAGWLQVSQTTTVRQGAKAEQHAALLQYGQLVLQFRFSQCVEYEIDAGQGFPIVFLCEYDITIRAGGRKDSLARAFPETMTRSPSALAIGTAIWPRLPEPPGRKTVSPGFAHSSSVTA